jgi:hypothetical protein
MIDERKRFHAVRDASLKQFTAPPRMQLADRIDAGGRTALTILQAPSNVVILEVSGCTARTGLPRLPRVIQISVSGCTVSQIA